MPWQDYKLVGFAPDLPVTTPGYLTQTTNCVPTDRGIGSQPWITVDSTSALDTVSLGGALVSKTDGTQRLFAGTAAKLWETNAVPATGALTDRSGAAYAATATDTWSFTQFGDVTLAANRQNIIQQINAGATFAAVGAAPCPKASILVTCGPTSAPFVMAFDFDDGTNAYRDGWFNSGLSDPTSGVGAWTTGTNQCAQGRLLDDIPGPITAAIKFRDGVIAWKRTGMYLGRYDGPPVIWSWQRISSDVGCIGKNACVMANDVIYWADDSGIWMFDGSYPRPVPGAVQKWWSDTVVTANPSTASRNYYKVLWDKPKHIIWFLSGVSTPSIGVGLSFNTVSGLWGHVVSGPFTNNADTTPAIEMFSARYFSVVGSNKIGSAHWGASGSEPGISSFVGWVFSDRVNTPIIKGIRPHWSIGPTTATSGWFSGNAYGLSTERSIQPGSANVASTFAGAFRQPGKLDVIASAEIMTFGITMTNGIDWEITGLSIDIDKAGRS